MRCVRLNGVVGSVEGGGWRGGFDGVGVGVCTVFAAVGVGAVRGFVDGWELRGDQGGSCGRVAVGRCASLSIIATR